ncbi:MAG: hypothetical protein IJV98_07070 [Clostridia bacterium]|nr:hypothetical protein [Clostridia bacterium]
MKRERTEITHLPKKAWEYSENAYLTMPAASATEFTGYTPVVPETEFEAESYSEVMPAPVTAKNEEELPQKTIDA